jgi:serralysin
VPAGGAGTMAGTAVLVNGPAVAGAIAVAGERDLYRFIAPGLGTYRVETAGPSDTVIRLLGPDSTATLIAENDDAVPGTLTSRLERGLTSGTYYVEVAGFGDTTGAYTLTVRR